MIYPTDSVVRPMNKWTKLTILNNPKKRTVKHCLVDISNEFTDHNNNLKKNFGILIYTSILVFDNFLCD